jgi:small subunit ribosomal protein S2
MTKQELITKLTEAGGHFGYSKTRRNPTVKPYLYTTKAGKDIIDLDKTAEQADKAADFLTKIIADKKQFLIIGTKPEARSQVASTGMKLTLPYAAERFIGGTLTNFGEIKKRVEKLADLVMKKEAGEFSVYTKKEQVLIDRDISRMTKNFGGMSQISGFPQAVLLVDSNHEAIALAEAKYMRIPVVALCNTDCNIKNVDYPIIVNDSSSASIQAVLDYVADKIESAE